MITNKKHLDKMLQESVMEIQELTDEVTRLLHDIISEEINDLSKQVIKLSCALHKHSERVLAGAEKYSNFPLSVVVRQQTALVKYIAQMNKIKDKYSNDKRAANLIEIVNLNLQYSEVNLRKFKDLLSAKRISNQSEV